MARHAVCALLVSIGIAAGALPAQEASVAVVNAASFQSDFPLSPGCWGSAFGNFAGVVRTIADSLPFPATLGGVQVLVGNAAAPLSFVDPTQINFLVPKAAAQGRSQFRVTVGGATVYDGFVDIWAVSPGLISVNPGDPTKPGAVLNQNGTINSQQNPARRGEIVQLFGVGADFSELPAVDGGAAPTDRLISTASPAEVYVSVVKTAPRFSGLAPGLVNAWQINVVVPDEPFVSGQVPVHAVAGGIATNPVSIWVAQ